MKTLSGFAVMFAAMFFADNLLAAAEDTAAGSFPFDISGLFVPVIVVVCALAILIALSLFLRNYIKVPPNQVAVISGRKHKLSTGEAIGFRLVRGGATFKWPLLERVDYLGLDVLSIKVEIKKAITKEGVPLNVAAIANVKFGSDDVSLRNAAERFLNKSEDEIRSIILNTLEGHLRSICCTLTVEQINSDRQKFAQQMVSEAAVDLQRMGIVIDALVVQHIEDEQQYLTSLGLKRTAEVKRDAKIGEAEATRDADIRTAEATRTATIESTNAQREGAVAKNENLAKIAAAERDLKTKEAGFAAEVAQAEATRDQAGPKAKALAEKDVLVAQVAAKEAQAQAEIALQEKLADRKKAELNATVIQGAEAERQKQVIEAEAAAAAAVKRAEGARDAAVRTAEGQRDVAIQEGAGLASKTKAVGLAEADANKAKLLAQAEGEAAKVRQMGLAEGEAIQAKLLAEAAGVLKKAEAYQKLDEAGKFMFILEKAPQIIDALGDAASKALTPAFDAVGRGLANVDNITIVDTGSGDGKSAVGRFANTAPTIFFEFMQKAKALGIDPTDLLKKVGVKVIPGAAAFGALDTGGQDEAASPAAGDAAGKLPADAPAKK